MFYVSILKLFVR